MKALWLWASSSILCTTLRKVNVQPSMGSSLCGLNLMFKISFIWIQNENKSKVIFEDTWPGVQDWSRPAQVWTPQGAAGRSPADQPQMEPVCSEMIHLISWKKEPDQSRVTYWESAGDTNEDNSLLSLTGLVTNTITGQMHFFSLKTKTAAISLDGDETLTSFSMSLPSSASSSGASREDRSALRKQRHTRRIYPQHVFYKHELIVTILISSFKPVSFWEINPIVS